MDAKHQEALPGTTVLISTWGAHSNYLFIDWLRARGKHHRADESGVVGGGHRQTAHRLGPSVIGSEIVDETPNTSASLSFLSCKVGETHLRAWV